MKINIVIKPVDHKELRFGEYGTVGEALHIASSLERHKRFTGEIWVEESPSMADCVLVGLPAATVRKYEVS